MRSAPPLLLAVLLLAGCEGRCPFRPDPVEPPPAPPAPAVAPAPTPAPPAPVVEPAPEPPKPVMAPAELKPQPPAPAEPEGPGAAVIAGLSFAGLLFLWLLSALYRRMK